ncbi:type II secretion system F family protein [Mycolicibacterium parafortuitum]|uniref:Type II secretion system protein GspF domain-containing protein n=1 Tax=Mycolicibacterium parafortuitum TaxID=39692 RepID=A0A375YBZ4_MYCPF|nr:type II secretion system F family protein [Mycolicibacterium parafortuitum]ORB32035.1 hypothetical protein BST38_04690 [Mycolicibacterium parafortuitum]SRX78625.1 hypothetical protein MPP7335_00352 [Mycolicibacterium parafortuitum]
MTVAALVLALAVLSAPAGPRRPVPLLHRARPRRRPSETLCAVAVCAAVAVLHTATSAAALGLLLATLIARRRAGRRRRLRASEAAALQDALDVLVGELRVGAHPVAAIEVAAQEARERIADSLTGVAARALLGADVAAGLRAVGRRSTSPHHWDRLAVCWHLAQTHGLAVATLMQAAQRDIAERERFRGRVEAGMAGARATAAILAGLPLLGVLLGHAIGAKPLGFLLSGGAGGWLLMLGAVFVCAGLLWSDRITAQVLT